MVCVGMLQSRGYSVWFILPDTSWVFVHQIMKNEILMTANARQRE